MRRGSGRSKFFRLPPPEVTPTRLRDLELDGSGVHVDRPVCSRTDSLRLSTSFKVYRRLSMALHHLELTPFPSLYWLTPEP